MFSSLTADHPSQTHGPGLIGATISRTARYPHVYARMHLSLQLARAVITSL